MLVFLKISPPFLVYFLLILWWQMESNQNENVMSIENELELNVNEY